MVNVRLVSLETGEGRKGACMIILREHLVEQLYASSQSDLSCKCRFKRAMQHCHAPLKSSKQTNCTLMMDFHHLSRGLQLSFRRAACLFGDINYEKLDRDWKNFVLRGVGQTIMDSTWRRFILYP